MEQYQAQNVDKKDTGDKSRMNTETRFFHSSMSRKLLSVFV